jgi:hypothetical protein
VDVCGGCVKCDVAYEQGGSNAPESHAFRPRVVDLREWFARHECRSQPQVCTPKYASNPHAPVSPSNPSCGDGCAGTGNPKAVGKDGQFMKTPDGHDVVFDKNNRPVAYIDPDGSPYALSLGQDGKYGYLQTPVNNFVVYDKNINNNPVDRDGNVITDQRGTPYALQEDGQYQKTPDGCQYFVYDKHNDNSIAPALRHTTDVIDYINQHGGTERLKPEQLKKELVDDSGFLDNEKLWKAVLKYDPIDVYEALVGSDNGKTAGITDRPTSDMAVATAASLIASSAIAAKSPYMKMEDLPKITFFENPEAKQETASYTKSGVEVTLHPHPDPVRIGAVMLTELNTVLGGRPWNRSW